MRNRDGGFTLIEILIVMMIIGLLAAIAIPIFLGQKERAKMQTLESSAKMVEREARVLITDFAETKPLLLMSSSGEQGCYQHSMAVKSMHKCSSVYFDVQMAGTYTSIEDLKDLYITHYNDALLSVSPYDSRPLLTYTDTPAAKSGHVLITNTTANSLHITAWSDSGAMIFNTNVSANTM